MKAVVVTFNQEKALVGAFSVIVQLHRLIVYSTNNNSSVAVVAVTSWVIGLGTEEPPSKSCLV